MIKLKRALNIILKHSNLSGMEKVNLLETPGRVLAEDICSDIDLPPFDRSAMDGFAVSAMDRSAVFEIIEDIPAGKIPEKKIKTGQCARIMTGAPLPEGADKVVKVEDTKQIAAGKIKITRQESRGNVSPKGEDVKKGERILKKGTEIRPQEVAALASAGRAAVKVYRQPGVTVISTGSELVEPGQKPKTGQIRDSNSPMLLAQLKRMGIAGNCPGIARDNFKETARLIGKALKTSDILILSGGVSAGDYDFVREAFSNCGVKLLFDKIAVQPGKPTSFGVKGKKLVFGLPGNPVSSFLIFELLVRPLIDKMSGRKPEQRFSEHFLAGDFARRHPEREQYYPVVVKKGSVFPLDFHGSAHMLALARANGLMRISRGVKQLSRGEKVNVRPI